jgi:lipooligosaccharide transport system permease protein
VSSAAHLIVLRHLWVVRRRRPWQLVVNGVFEPFLYLMSIGVGVGQLIGTLSGAGPEGTRYAAFVAPALLATSAMNSAVNETTGSVWWRLRFEKVYDAIITTPMTPADIALGEVLASMLRSAVASTCFLAVISALGLVHSWWALMCIPGALLVSYAFSGAGLAVTTYLREFHHHQYVQLFMLPMFLFSTTFYPLSVYPPVLQVVVASLPLYQATELLRGFALGQPGPGLIWAAVYLLALGTIGTWLAQRRFAKLLMH